MLEVNVHSSSKPAVTTVSQSQDNNQSSVETVSGPGSKEQPSYQSEVEAVGKDAGATVWAAGDLYRNGFR